MARRHRRSFRPDLPRPSIPAPRPHLFEAIVAFVREAAHCPGVSRIALVGSLATTKPIPKDADVLVTFDPATDLEPLALAGRRLKGRTQYINLAADIFLTSPDGRYLGRVCGHRECHPRARCLARNCGARQHLRDDLDVLTLPSELLARPPAHLWPRVVRNQPMPDDTEALLLIVLESTAAANEAAR